MTISFHYVFFWNILRKYSFESVYVSSRSFVDNVTIKRVIFECTRSFMIHWHDEEPIINNNIHSSCQTYDDMLILIKYYLPILSKGNFRSKNAQLLILCLKSVCILQENSNKAFISSNLMIFRMLFI